MTRFASLFLLVLLSGCENVEWGGVQVRLHEPEYQRVEASRPDTAVERPPLDLPGGPLAFHVKRGANEGRATIQPVAEVLSPSELRAVGPTRAERSGEYADSFVSRYYAPDQAYHLFRGTARVGTFYVGTPAVRGSGLCVVLEAEGHVELRPQADTLSEFVAWAPTEGPEGEGLPLPEYRSEMLTLAGVLARRGVQERGLPGAWRFGPPADLRALDVGTGPRGFAATFVVGDTLALGSPPDSAGTVFMVADFDPARGYFPLYFDAEWYAPGQKRALRWVDAVDLLGATGSEWLVRAYGDQSAWYEVLGEREGGRGVLWSGRRPVCEARQLAGLN